MLQLNAYAWQFDEPVYTLTSLGGSGSLSYSLGPLNAFTATYLHQLDSSRVAMTAPEDSRALLTAIWTRSVRRQSGWAAFGRSIRREPRYDRRPGQPAQGYRASARIEKGGGWLPGSFTYRNIFTMGRFYQAVGPLTLAGRLQFGSIVAQDDHGLPFSKRYFLGGADSLRGWGRLEISPVSASGTPIGGRTVLAVTGELRFPLIEPVSGAAFVDAGNVWAESWEVHLTDLRSNVGAGVRVDSPLGLVRVDLGYQLTFIEQLRVDREPQHRRWRVHVSLGQAF